jgi:RNA-binding protein YhbY
MKEAKEKTHKLSRLLEAALDTALVLVIGYALILLSQSQPLF